MRERINAESEVCISAITLLELALLTSRGRLPLLPTPAEWLEIAQSVNTLRVMPLTATLCLASVSLPGVFHRDPADRLIVALARELDADLVTADREIRAYSHVRTIPAD